MSNNQKPSGIKLVSNGVSARAPEIAEADEAGTAPVGEGAPVDMEATGAPVQRGSRVPAFMFLAGCAIGGAGLAAWPHLAS